MLLDGHSVGTISRALVAARLALHGIKSYGAGPCLGGFSFVGVQLGPDYHMLLLKGRAYIHPRAFLCRSILLNRDTEILFYPGYVGLALTAL